MAFDQSSIYQRFWLLPRQLYYLYRLNEAFSRSQADDIITMEIFQVMLLMDMIMLMMMLILWTVMGMAHISPALYIR